MGGGGGLEQKKLYNNKIKDIDYLNLLFIASAMLTSSWVIPDFP